MNEKINYLYSIPYLLLVFGYILLTFTEYRYTANNEIKKGIRFLCISLFLFFWGFKGFIGWDWTNYYPFYENIKPVFSVGFWTNFSLSDRIEPGFIFYLSIVKLFSSDYQFLVFISALIDVLILNKFFKVFSPNYAFSFLVFTSLGMVLEVDLLRNSKSLFICLLALPYIQERRIFPYMFLMLLALSFHSSAIFFIPLYFFAHKKIPRTVLIVILGIGNIVFLSQVQFVKPIITAIGHYIGGSYGAMIDGYMQSDIYAQVRGISIGYIERLFTSLLIIIFYRKLLQQNPANVIFVNMFIIFISIHLLFSEIAVLIDRVALLFVVSYWILWPSLVKCFNSCFDKILFVIMICIYALLRTGMNTTTIMACYENVFFGISSYDQRQELFNKYAEDILNMN